MARKAAFKLKKAEAWKEDIVAACKEVGTYQPCFEAVIDSLATILERRDEVNDVYIKSGGQPIVKYTNKGGNTNPTKHPALVLWNELNQMALTYWRDLGLTPSGLRKINEEAIKPKRRNALTDALKDLDKEL